MRRGAGRQRVVQDVPEAGHRVSRLGPAAARLDEGTSQRAPPARAAPADRAAQDKERVAEYKANIKAQLTRAGLIRGQPRSVYSTLASSSTSVGQPSGASSSRYAPGPSSLRGGRSEGFPSYDNVQGYDSSRFHHAANTMSGMSGLGASFAVVGASSSTDVDPRPHKRRCEP